MKLPIPLTFGNLLLLGACALLLLVRLVSGPEALDRPDEGSRLTEGHRQPLTGDRVQTTRRITDEGQTVSDDRHRSLTERTCATVSRHDLGALESVRQRRQPGEHPIEAQRPLTREHRHPDQPRTYRRDIGFGAIGPGDLDEIRPGNNGIVAANAEALPRR